MHGDHLVSVSRILVDHTFIQISVGFFSFLAQPQLKYTAT